MAKRAETNLVQARVPRVMDAPIMFGETTEFGGTPIVLIPQRQHTIKMKIPIGTRAIVSRRGASVGIYEPGLYYRPAFYRIDYLVTTHHIPYHFSVNACPTKDNVLISLGVDFLLHVNDPETFVYSIGPENMEELLRATQAETVRGLVRTVTINDAYDLRGYESDDMLATLNEKMNPYGITVDQVTIANVALPDDLAQSMQKETTFETKQIEQMKKQEYSLLIHQDNNVLKRLIVDRKNEKLKVEEEAKMSRMAIQHQIEELSARARAILAEIKADTEAEVACVKAQSEMEIGKKKNEVQMMLSQLQTEAEMEAEKILAEADKQVAEMKAQANVTIASNKAQAISALATAEKQVAQALKQKRAYEAALARIDAIKTLAYNPNVVIAGESGDNIMQMMVMRESAKVLGIKNK